MCCYYPIFTKKSLSYSSVILVGLVVLLQVARSMELQAMLAVTVKISNQCVVGVLESFLSFIFLQ